MVFFRGNIRIMVIAILFISTAIPETALTEATSEEDDAGSEKDDKKATTEGDSEMELSTFCLHCAFGRFGMVAETTTPAPTTTPEPTTTELPTTPEPTTTPGKTTTGSFKDFIEEGECSEEAKKNKTIAAYCLETTTHSPATTTEGQFMLKADAPPPTRQTESESCPPGEEFRECDFLCQPSCKRPKIPRRCPYICLARCLCKKPLVRRESDGKCVRLSTCPKYKKPRKHFGYAPRHKYGPPIDQGLPSVDRFLPPPDYERRWKKCPPQETFSMCAGACQPTCRQPKPKCNRGCICKKPFVRREDGKCVPRSKCHCKKRKSCRMSILEL